MKIEDRLEHGRKLSTERYESEHVQTVDHERPVAMTKEGYIELGHEPKPPQSVIREMCVACCGGSLKEVRLCRCTGCPLFPFRDGSNPWRHESTPDQKAAARVRLQPKNRPNGKEKNPADGTPATTLPADAERVSNAGFMAQEIES